MTFNGLKCLNITGKKILIIAWSDKQMQNSYTDMSIWEIVQD